MGYISSDNNGDKKLENNSYNYWSYNINHKFGKNWNIKCVNRWYNKYDNKLGWVKKVQVDPVVIRHSRYIRL